MKNRKLLLIVSLVLALTMSLGGTLAYLTDTDADVNVMTLGKVQIEQIELERIDHSESAADNKDNFQEYTQGQMLLPATGTDQYGNIPYAVDENGNNVLQQLPYGGAMQLWDDDGGNVMDKLVFVKNTGNTNAYVRTLIAYEGTSVGGSAEDLIHVCYNGTFWDAKEIGTIKVEGVDYSLYEYTYKRDDGAGAGVLKPGETTRPSLLQLYMASWADNKDLEQFGATYDILVLSQAVQAQGFEDAKTALDAAFNETTTTNHPWNGEGDVVPELPVTVAATEAELAAALAKGGNVLLTADISVAETLEIPEGVTTTLDLNGKTITGTMHKNDGSVLQNNGTLTVEGGTIASSANNGGSAIVNNGTLTVNNATLNGAPNADGSWPSYTINNSGNMTLNNCELTSIHGTVASYGEAAVVTLNNCESTMTGIAGFTNHGFYTYSNGKIVVNGGTYANNAADQNSTGGSMINGAVEVNAGTFTGRIENYYGTPVIKGGTFSANPSKYVAEGYTATDNGNGTWTVSAVTE